MYHLNSISRDLETLKEKQVNFPSKINESNIQSKLFHILWIFLELVMIFES